MYLEQVNYELNKKINDFVCNSNDATTLLNLLQQSPVAFQEAIKN